MAARQALMRPERTIQSIAATTQALNARFRNSDTFSLLRDTLGDATLGRLALVSSFGAESAVLLHLISRVRPDLPIFLIDTELLFQETLDYQKTLAERFGLTDIRVLKAPRAKLFARDPDNLLSHFDPDACCHLRKVEPLEKALSGFDGWISGRKRFQGGLRQHLPLFEAEDNRRIKINPLAHWSRDDLRAYMRDHALPPHPLAAKGYPSIGCAPCTTTANTGEDTRAGRWRNSDKVECGIHLGATPTNSKRSAA